MIDLLNPNMNGVAYRAKAIIKAGGIEQFIATHDVQNLSVCLRL